MAKRPAFLFYPGDWMKDPALRSVSIEARGLWIDMLCLMHECDRRGYLQHATGKPVSLEQLARMTGCSTEQVSRLLQELIDSGVTACTEHGSFYSRRMIRDEAKSAKCAEAGKLGATLKGQAKGQAKGPPQGDLKGDPKGACQGALEDENEYTASVESEKQSEQKTKTTLQTTELATVILAIRGRHPKVRTCGPTVISKKLATIIGMLPKIRKLHPEIQTAGDLLARIDEVHAARCATHDWVRDGGQYAKGLENWLAPTEMRYLDMPHEGEFEAPQTSKPLKSNLDKVLEIQKFKEQFGW